MREQIRFAVDPKTNSEDSERRMAYGLDVTSPWGGSLFINFPEHLEYMPGTRGIARHHDKRKNVWQVSQDGQAAQYDVESVTEPGVLMRVSGRVVADRALFEMTLTNRSDKVLQSIRPMLCHQYGGLVGFAPARSNNFAHTYVVVNGQCVALSDLPVERVDAYARMAQADGCPDRHNWWAEKMGGMIETPIDFAFTAIAATVEKHTVAVFWTPGKNLLSNSAIPCIHADPYYGDLLPGQSRSARGVVVFSEAPVETLAAELSAEVVKPWETA